MTQNKHTKHWNAVFVFFLSLGLLIPATASVKITQKQVNLKAPEESIESRITIDGDRIKQEQFSKGKLNTTLFFNRKSSSLIFLSHDQKTFSKVDLGKSGKNSDSNPKRNYVYKKIGSQKTTLGTCDSFEVFINGVKAREVCVTKSDKLNLTSREAELLRLASENDFLGQIKNNFATTKDEVVLRHTSVVLNLPSIISEIQSIEPAGGQLEDIKIPEGYNKSKGPSGDRLR